MFFFAFGIVTEDNFSSDGNMPAAYASSWINLKSQQEAESRARELLIGQGWRVVTVEDAYEIRRDDYSDDSEGLPYYEQALIDGEVTVLYVPKE